MYRLLTPPRSTRWAFTLVEMLLVLIVVGVMSAMVIPRVQAHRAAGKRAVIQSLSNDLAAAMELHYTTHGRYPLDGGRRTARVDGAFSGALPGDAANPERLLGFTPETPLTVTYTYLGPKGYQLYVTSSEVSDFACTLTAGKVGAVINNTSISTSTLCVLDPPPLVVAVTPTPPPTTPPTTPPTPPPADPALPPLDTAALIPPVVNQQPSAAVVSCSPTTALAGTERTCSIVTPSTDPDGGTLSYRWSSRGRTSSEGGLTATYQYDVPTAENIAVATLDGQGGFVTSNVVELTWTNRPPTAPGVTCSPVSAPALTSVTCSITTPSVDPDGPTPVTTYSWSTFNDPSFFGGTSTGLNKTYRASGPMTFQVTVTVFDTQGASNTTTIDVEATNNGPTLGALVCLPLSAAAGVPVTCIASGFTDLDGGDVLYEYAAYNAAWMLLDMRSAAPNSVSAFLFGLPGSYIVQVRASDTQGSPWTPWVFAQDLSIVNTPPTAPFISCSPATIQSGQSSTCSIQTPSIDTDGGVLTYTWSNTGRIGPATGPSTTYRMTTPGSALASVTAADGQGGTSSISNAVNLEFANQAPTAPVVTCNASVAPTGTPVTCSIETPSTDPDGGTVAYTWSATDRTGPATGLSTTYTRTTPWWIEAVATASDGQGGSTSSTLFSLTFTNRAPSAPTLTCSSTWVSTGTEVTCTASGSTDPDGGTVSYDWTYDGFVAISGPGNTTATFTRTSPQVLALSVRSRDNQNPRDNNNVPAPVLGVELFSDYTAQNVAFLNQSPTAPVITCSPTSLSTGSPATCSISTAGTDPDGGTLNYTWSSEGRTSAETGATALYTRTTPGTVSVTAQTTDGQGGLSPISLARVVTFENRQPTAAVITCTPLTGLAATARTCSIVTPSIDPDGGTLSYRWSSRGRTSPEFGLTATYQWDVPTAELAIVATLDGQGGFVTSNFIELYWTNRPPTPPGVSCSPNPVPSGTDIICAITTPSVDPDGQGPITAYNWSTFNTLGWFGGTNLGLNKTYRASGPMTFDVTVLVFDVQGDPAVTTVSVTVTNRGPDVGTLSCSPLSASTTDPVTCVATGFSDPDGGELRYEYEAFDAGWVSVGVQTESASPTATFTFAQPGSYVVQTRARDTQGSAWSTWIAAGPVSALHVPPSTPEISCTPAAPVTGSSSICSIRSPSAALLYTWSFANRTGFPTGISTLYQMNTPGSTTVTAIASDAQGGTSPFSIAFPLTFTNRAPSTPSLSCSSASAPTGTQITCTATASADPDGGIITYQWSPTGRTGPATGPLTTYTASTPSLVTVTATATDGQGGTSPTSGAQSLTFDNRQPTAAVISCVPLTGPAATPRTCSIVTPSTDPDGGTISYRWSFRGRTSPEVALTATYQWDVPTSELAILSTLDGQGGFVTSNFVELYWTNRPPTAPVISCSPQSGTTGSTLTCSIQTPSIDADGDAVTYAWSSTGRIGAASGMSTTYRMTTPGTTSVTAAATDGQGGTSATSNSISLAFTNRPPTTPVVTCSSPVEPTSSTITCSILTPSTDPDGGTISYTWSALDRTGPATGTSTTYTRALPGWIQAVATAQDGQGASVSSEFFGLTFNNRSPNTPTLSCTPTSVPTGQSIVCTASGSIDPDGGAVTYEWIVAGTVVFSGSANNIATISSATATNLTASARARDGQTTVPSAEGVSAYGSQAGLTFTNRPPSTPVVTCASPSSPTGTLITCSILTPSTDPDGGAISYTWSSTGRTGPDTGTSTTYNLASAGVAGSQTTNISVVASANDGQGGVTPSDGITITFTNRPPSDGVVTASTGWTVPSGTTVTFTFDGYVDSDGTIESYLAYMGKYPDNNISRGRGMTTSSPLAYLCCGEFGAEGAFDVVYGTMTGQPGPSRPATVTATYTLPGVYWIGGAPRDNTEATSFLNRGFLINTQSLTVTNRQPVPPTVTCSASVSVGSPSTCTASTWGDPEGQDVELRVTVFDETWAFFGLRYTSGWLSGGGFQTANFSFTLPRVGSFFVIADIQDRYDLTWLGLPPFPVIEVVQGGPGGV